MNIVLDTNIWISFLIGRTLDEMEDRFLLNDIHVLTSEDQLREVREVIYRPKFSRYFSDVERDQLEDFLVKTAYAISPIEKIELCRDPKDDFLLELAIAGDATNLVTGDDDLLVLGTIRSTRIIRLSEFQDLLVHSP
ncbi:MAG TPA: putative toxin-antitoxin system toxin component, PIN family [Rectinemataceae bacterium]|nr:putative toxin-antitoxin system toxin component, PIN family [Rectinemataceae bacterium]